MIKRQIIKIVLLFLWFSLDGQHPGFSDIRDYIPGIHVELRYFGTENFMGRRVDGYRRDVCLMSDQAAAALKNVQQDLAKEGLGLKIFDAYRPQKAVNHFIRWSKDPADTLKKREYYPELEKSVLFDLGYISKRSGHTRGSTVDLTIASLHTGEELDMGGPYDYFGQLSHHNYEDLSEIQRKNRKLLKSLMEKHGFRSYSKEWWHYTLKGEPFPDTYFDFDIY